MTRTSSSSMVDLPSPPRLLLIIRRHEDGNPHPWIRHGRPKPVARLVARRAPPDALGWGGGWPEVAEMRRQAVAHEVQNFAGRHPCATGQV